MVPRIDCCPACGCADVELVIRADQEARQRYLHFSKIKYDSLIDHWIDSIGLDICRCTSCQHHWYRSQPDAESLKSMYAAGKHMHLKANETPTRIPSNRMIKEMGRLKKYISKASPQLLDYGSGFGRWARAGVKAGFKVTAYEPTHERGCEQDNIEFRLLHDLTELNGRRFDAINLEQVLEHTPDPLQTLQDLYRYCNPHTVVRISVPNIYRCPEGKDLWKKWPFDGKRAHTMAPFEHLHGFTPRSLYLITQRAGFRRLNFAKFLFHYKTESIRYLIGRALSRLGQTLIFVSKETVHRDEL